MKIRYIHNHKTLFEKHSEYLQHVPRIGEHVYLDHLMMKVTDVQHCVMDDCVIVYLGE